MVEMLKYSAVLVGVVVCDSGRGRGSGTFRCGVTGDVTGRVATLGTPVEGGDDGVATLGTSAALGGAGEGKFVDV